MTAALHLRDLHLPTFYDYVRRAPFGGRLSQTQVDGITAILAAWTGTDDRHLAYILATAFHETGGKMQPVREGFARTDAGARRAVAGRRYAREYGGHVYYGRGLVQLTWRANYARMGEALGLPLETQPDLLLDMAISATVLVKGMVDGMFTGHKLTGYFNANVDDPEGARRIVNGTDKASLIAGYHKNFLDSLKAARRPEAGPATAPIPVDGPKLATDPTAIGGVLAGLGGLGGIAAAAGPVLQGVTSPWALGAFVVLALGVFLVLTGRVQLKLKGGV
jgi:hypothetical protein